MASANLDSEAAFTDRARKIGLTEDTLAGLLTNHFNTFGRLAFAVSATPTTLTDEAVDNWIDGLGVRVSGFQKASLRRLLFEAVSMAIEEVRARINLVLRVTLRSLLLLRGWIDRLGRRGL